MSLVISDQILQASGMSEAEFMLEVAIMLFDLEKISIGQASQIAVMNQSEFQKILAQRGIPSNYKIAATSEDLENEGESGWM